MGWCSRIIGLLSLAWTLPALAEPAALTFAPNDRVLVLAPHPDDEVLGCAGVIQTAKARGLPVRVAFLTYGDNNQWSFWVYRHRPVIFPAATRNMGLIRHDEAVAAAQELGLPATELRFLGYPDFRTLDIWRSHWDAQPALRSMFTHVTAVPYANAQHPGAPYKGEAVLDDLKQVFREFQPTKIFLSHPADHNGDHRALYLFARVAAWDGEQEGRPAPTFLPYLIHSAGWPTKGAKLTPPEALEDDIAWQQLDVTEAQLAHKRTALEAHRTQYKTSPAYLKQFLRRNELFGDFPVISLRAEPLPAASRSPVKAMPAELTQHERHVFVGLEQRHVRLDKDALVYSFDLSRPLAYGVEATMSICGYRSDKPFAQMPKLLVKVGETGEAVYDNGRRLDDDTVTITRSARQITVRVPLTALGQPQRVLSSARTYLGEVPLDSAAWRVLAL